MASNNLAKPESAEKLLTTFFNENTFTALNGAPEVNVITGFGYTEGKLVCAFAFDGGKNSGAVNSATASSLLRLYKYAAKIGSPIVGFYNTSGGSIREGAQLLSAYSEIISVATKISGTVPQIAVIDGVCGGSSAIAAELSDVIIATEGSEFFAAPDSSTSAVDAAKTGSVHIIEKDGVSAAKKAREIIRLLPENNLVLSAAEINSENDAEITAETHVKDVAKAVSNADGVFELYESFGKNSFTAIAEIGWRIVALVAAEETLSPDDSAKIARFVHFADAFSLPIVTIVDVTGFEGGEIRAAARLAQAYAAATSPKISVITKRAYSSAFVALSNSDISLAWKGAVISPLEPKAAAVFLNPEKITDANDTSALVNDYVDKYADADKLGLCDRIIAPCETRQAIIDTLEFVSEKREINPPKKHINTVF